MELPLSCIERRVRKIKKNIFSSNFDLYNFVCPSTYDTAWLAMIPHSKYPSQPMFNNYLDWLLNNQKPQGYWGESDTIECLPPTIVSMVALIKWNTGKSMVDKGRSFIHANADKLLNEVKDDCPRWLAIVLPAMIELADEIMGLDVLFTKSSRDTMSYIANRRKSFLNKEEVVGDFDWYPPLMSYLEALPPSYVNEKDICKNLSADGSLFQSPSATAKAFMAYGTQECLDCLQSLAQRCPKAVPQAYPMDEDLIKLCIVNQLQKLGLGEYFMGEIEILLTKVYRNYSKEQNSRVQPLNMNALQLQKDSLAFELLRTHGFKVSPLRFCWFLNHDEIRAKVEKDYEHFSSAMLHVFRASNLMFSGEYELKEARTFSRKLLEQIVSTGKGCLLRQIEHELSFPWFARLNHLEHRMWIEEREVNALWKGKMSYNRVSYLYNDELLQLATLNFELKQLLYKNELKELKSWAENYEISNMGFGREKTSYCYFAIAAALTSLPYDSYVRMFLAKSAIIITVADDFFDSIGSLNELQILTDAVQRWDTRGLSSHSKVIFDALDNLVSEASRNYLQQEGTSDDISRSLKDLWYEVFLSWLIEAKWSRNGHKPSLDCYLKTGMTSACPHVLVLPSSCFLKPSLPTKTLKLTAYENITKLLMIICRLLNDVVSYQKEKEEGKLNSVLINMMENPEFNIEDSINFVREIVEKKKKELLELVLIDGLCDLPKPSKQLHLACLKVFEMFYNSKNRFDSNTDLVEDINKAIYLPLGRTTKCFSPQTFPKKKHTISIIHNNFPFKHNSKIGFTRMRFMTPKVGLGFI
ncbi:S-linalool synthase isoform X2 [Medicago truncatula]|uniref:S-linalool synthase isoform X2 n=1 Tax=Medicago truncatula TaxID=3880 RepID=UPI001967DBC4|nr:S-linalool synthase-like isoform X2 [Medicago truncatula]